MLEHLTRALDEKEDARRLAWVLAAIARPQLNCNNPGVCYNYNLIQPNPANLSNESDLVPELNCNSALECANVISRVQLVSSQ